MKNNTENHEYSIYGSSRVGNYSTTHGFVAQNGAMILERVLGKRQYELSNHLGNVLTTLTDQKYRVSNVNTDYLYQPIVTSATDYFPFGMQMPGRTYTLQNGKYRYGFNGMERDDEVHNPGSWYQFGDFGYDPRTGRRNNTDPIVKVWESPYATFRNNPILYSDPSGKDGVVTTQESAPITKEVGKGKKKHTETFNGGTKENPNIMTVKANYYYNKTQLNAKYTDGSKALEEAVTSYNKTNYTVQGKDGKYYTVKFDIKLTEVTSTSDQEMKKDYASKDYKSFESENGIQYFPYGNTIGLNLPNMTITGSELGSASYNTISLLTSQIDNIQNDLQYNALYNVFLHEIGHNLGGAHIDKGAMNKVEIVTNNGSDIKTANSRESYTTLDKNKLSLTNVEMIISTIWGGGRSGSDVPEDNGRPGQVLIRK